ncbi:hypothetical protein, partial [Citrobacter freundii]|uniref:hypothetical protein n=1 Tax=Citrobacter freundii TaxID=546 RepID=UPI00207D22BF
MNWQRFNKVSSFSGETSGIVKKNFIITAALLSSLFLAAIVNLLYIADNLNNKADARSSLLLQKALTNRQEKIRTNLRHCCKVSDEAAFCLIQRPYISKTLLTRRISPRG